MSGRKTVLLVEDDEGTLRVLSDGLSNVLGMFDVATAHHGREAIDVLEHRAIDVLVTDLAMPVMDGFGLIAYVTNHRPKLPVVVLSALAPADIDQRLVARGGLSVLCKPASYQDVGSAVLAALELDDMGSVEGIPLASVLQLLESERRTCTVLVTSGKRRGRLHFQSGRLLNAFSDDFGAEGEAAAYDIMSWGEAALEFEPLPEGVRKLIYTPLQLMLIELATTHDEALHARRGFAVPAAWGFDGEDDEDGDDTPETDETAPAASAVAPTPAPDPAGNGQQDSPVEAGIHAEPEPMDAEAVTPEDVASIARSTVTEEAAQALRTLRPWEAPDMDEPRDPHAPEEAVAEATPDAVAERGESLPPVGWTPGTDGEAAAPDVAGRVTDPSSEAEPAAPPTPATGAAGDEDPHVADLLGAIERLAQRAKEADAALAAVTEEVDAFRGARQRLDEMNAQRERRRLELEALRTDVAHLAREILGRVDGMFDVFAEPTSSADGAPDAPAAT